MAARNLAAAALGLWLDAQASAAEPCAWTITLERSGGFAGLTQTSTVEAAALNEAENREVCALAQAADVFNLPEDMRASPPQPDRFQYRLTIAEGELRYTVAVDEPSMPPTLAALIARLRELAAKR